MCVYKTCKIIFFINKNKGNKNKQRNQSNERNTNSS